MDRISNNIADVFLEEISTISDKLEHFLNDIEDENQFNEHNNITSEQKSQEELLKINLNPFLRTNISSTTKNEELFRNKQLVNIV